MPYLILMILDPIKIILFIEILDKHRSIGMHELLAQVTQFMVVKPWQYCKPLFMPLWRVNYLYVRMNLLNHGLTCSWCMLSISIWINMHLNMWYNFKSRQINEYTIFVWKIQRGIIIFKPTFDQGILQSRELFKLIK